MLSMQNFGIFGRDPDVGNIIMCSCSRGSSVIRLSFVCRAYGLVVAFCPSKVPYSAHAYIRCNTQHAQSG